MWKDTWRVRSLQRLRHAEFKVTEWGRPQETYLFSKQTCWPAPMLVTQRKRTRKEVVESRAKEPILFLTFALESWIDEDLSQISGWKTVGVCLLNIPPKDTYRLMVPSNKKRWSGVLLYQETAVRCPLFILSKESTHIELGFGWLPHIVISL